MNVLPLSYVSLHVYLTISPHTSLYSSAVVPKSLMVRPPRSLLHSQAAASTDRRRRRRRHRRRSVGRIGRSGPMPRTPLWSQLHGHFVSVRPLWAPRDLRPATGGRCRAGHVGGTARPTAPRLGWWPGHCRCGIGDQGTRKGRVWVSASGQVTAGAGSETRGREREGCGLFREG